MTNTKLITFYTVPEFVKRCMDETFINEDGCIKLITNASYTPLITNPTFTPSDIKARPTHYRRAYKGMKIGWQNY